MNDLKAAVDYFKSLLHTIADDEWNREARNSATAALVALREKQQREYTDQDLQSDIDWLQVAKQEAAVRGATP